MDMLVPQHILDALTDVAMPQLGPSPQTDETCRLAGAEVPVYRSGCLVVGSGAAGLRTAVELKRRGGQVLIASQSAWGGTSACSGSDKQTLHTANTADQGDNFHAMARAIRAGGAMDEDTAYVEAVGSPRMMASLQFLGLPLPQDTLGGTLRYQTDHDETGRATSCGPRTSRLMVKVLAEEALRLDIPILNQATVVQLLTEGQAAARHIVGALVMRPRAQTRSNPLGLTLVLAPTIVLAAGGPGELYRDSVYPKSCFGSLGLALQSGLELVNLTESQFGIGTRREGFPWNLSGTYVQSIPHIFSRDASGQEHHFLADYYRTTQELASNIFRKGYQWPFHATRMLGFASSLLDLAVWREGQAGRRVYMDFNRNPLPLAGDQPFDLRRLDRDVATYLGSAGATQALPIDRLRHMNPLAIELYRRYKVDIAAEPLEFAVNNQHMNGGIAVDTWGRSSLTGVYAVGEAAGTHGVTRPGGSALNAGQVFGTRVGEHIAASKAALHSSTLAVGSGLAADVQSYLAVLKPGSSLTIEALRNEVQARMSHSAGLICAPEPVRRALQDARALNHQITRQGLAYRHAAEAVRALQWQQMALASEAVLTALDDYISQGGGSRGARAICTADGSERPQARSLDLVAYRFRPEHEADKQSQICISYRGGQMQVNRRPNRRLDEAARPFFEREWPAWLTGAIFDLGDDQSLADDLAPPPKIGED